MRDKSAKLYQEVDFLITEGKINEARGKLLKLRKTELSVSYRAKVASLARRVDLPHLSLILLRSIVHPTEGKQSFATDEEKSEYAAALADLGAGVEALKLLSSVNKAKYPAALLHTAFACISQWDYKAAIPVLHDFVSHPEVNAKQKFTGRINLAASLVHEKEKEAEQILPGLLEESIKAKYTLAEGYIRMLCAEYDIGMRKWDSAALHIKESERIYSDINAVEGLFLRKWKAFLNMQSSGIKQDAKIHLDPVRKEALEKKNWETLRDCDFTEAVFTKNKELFLKVYFGSSFPAKKLRLLTEYEQEIEIPEVYHWATSSQEPKKVINILQDNAEVFLPTGQSSYRLFFTLSSDFYRPLRIAELHHSAYPDEFFNPLSSPAKVHQGVCRLRQWLKKNSLPIEIKEEDGNYRLQTSKANIAICIPNVQMAENRGQGAVQKLIASFGTEKEFSLKQASEVLGGSYWHVNRLLKKAEDDGMILRTSRGRSTRYCILGEKKKSA